MLSLVTDKIIYLRNFEFLSRLLTGKIVLKFIHEL
ncbi:hypothetical protein EV145_10717 [Flavobacterium sp. 245]|nr:hypothetical protein EV145_10717 [Flavobacterium sp. 245]